MQSIYFFRDADAELFPRVRDYGLEILGDQPLNLDSVELTANFRTIPALVEELNSTFRSAFAADDGSGIHFAEVSQRARTLLPAGLRAWSPGKIFISSSCLGQRAVQVPIRPGQRRKTALPRKEKRRRERNSAKSWS